MAASGQDPNRIDVSLNIMSDATLAAVNNLTNQLSSLREFLASQGTTNPVAQAEGAGRWIPQSGGLAYTRPGETQAGIFHGPSSPIIAGDPSNPSQGAETSRQRAARLREEYTAYMNDIQSRADGRRDEVQAGPALPLSPDAAAAMSRNLSDIQRYKLAGQERRLMGGSRLDRFFELYPGTQRDPYEDRAYEFEAGQPSQGGSALPEGMGYPSQGPPTTSSMAGYGDMPGWAQALQREGITPESRLGLTIPRLGEFTIQDKLNMAAQWMGRSAMRRQDSGDGGRGTTAMGQAAAGAAYLRDQSASIVAVNREFQRLRNFSRGEELGGEALGFSRESALGDVSILGAGFRLNYPGASEASREGLREEFTQRRVQAAAGVSGEEAQRIRQTVAGMGYSGDMNQRLQMDLFRPLQQRGIAPESVAPLVDQGIRQGNVSVAALRDTMIDLADAARNANMSLEETTASALEYSESVQEIGANYEASLRNAATFTRSGLDPRIAGQAMQSPMMQGILSMQTGLPPQLQGIIGAPGVMQGMAQAIQQGLDLGSPYANMPDRTVTSASGQKITISTGRDAQIAMAQQTTGLPRQIIERYMDNPDFLQAGGTAQTMVGQMQDQIRGMTHRERRVDDYESTPTVGRGATPGPRRKVGSHIESYDRHLTDDDRRRLQHGSTSDSVVQYDELEAQMIAMDPKNRKWTDRVHKISRDHSNVEDRLKVAQRIIGEATNVKPEPDYLVGLTPEARKILKIEKPKDRSGALPRANAGGAPANAAMQGPGFPSSTGGAMSYATGP